ncbi:hypothetical protein FB45DRAFT_841983 [Roridomyces roridus]|uniref:MYND-type domain-containing protein n=1 Tax=Roridomyces roridus TaxID=1738132 RepID=A0AAD7FCG4_9AGAR|nr:hypothetical protein FB45DRAFT_841983 [Roridomyces roridus]
MPSEPKSRPLSTLADVGAICYHCHAAPSPSTTLQKCSSCRLVCYCSASCQSDSWPTHKGFCRAFAALGKPPLRDTVPWVTGTPTSRKIETEMLHKLSHIKSRQGYAYPTRDADDSLLMLEPRCLHCGRTHQNLPRAPLPCPDCHFAFACEEHWALVRDEHTQLMCEGGYDGLSQCALNQDILKNEEWQRKFDEHPMSDENDSGEGFQWVPKRRADSGFVSLENVTWAERSLSRAAEEIPVGPASAGLRKASEFLSMPLTALYALECLNSDFEWTRKDGLVIHLIGAHVKELYGSLVFETILHELPDVRQLRLVICGKDLESMPESMVIRGEYELLCCADCQSRHKRRIYSNHPVHYHDYVTQLGSDYAPPDLVIAIDSGASQPMYRAAWKKTIQLLVEREVPSVFTAFFPEEALTDNQLLLGTGAGLVSDLGPCRNPWGSLLSRKALGTARSFDSDSMCLAGGFRGRA